MNAGELAILIPLFGIVFGVGVAIVAILSQSRQRMKEAEHRHKERLTAIERGLEVPPDPPRAGDEQPSHSQYLRRGMVWTAVGIAIYFAMPDLVGQDVANLGAIPAAVGIATLLYYFIGKPKDDDKAGGGPVTPA